LLPFTHAQVVQKVPLVASGLWRGILPVGPGRAACPAIFCPDGRWGARHSAKATAILTAAPLFFRFRVGHIPQVEAPARVQAALIVALAEMNP
jgi:hypothetical protein